MNARRRHFALCILAGLFFAAAQAPLGIWPLVFAGFALSLWLLKSAASAKRAAWTGWSIGASYFAASLIWIIEPFLVDVATHGWMAPFALAGMAGGLALFWALPFWIAARLGRPASILALWPLAEYARSTVLTGFPWGLQAYAFADTPFAQFAAHIGPHGLGAFALIIAALPVLWDRRKGIAFGLLALIALGAPGTLRLGNAPETANDAPIIRLTQPNAPQHQKWDRDYMPIFFKRQIAATEAKPKPDLIVWPETSLPNWLNDAERTLLHIADAAAGVPVLIGAQRYEGLNAFNSLALLRADGQVGQVYDKHHLVPFGEYLPLGTVLSRLGMSTLTETFGGFAAGQGPELIDLGPIGTALPLICYEAVFPDQMQSPEGRPAFLLHVTNDAWFGTWSGPYQHLVQAQFRAIEQGLPLLRSANTGITAAIDAHGRVLDSLALGVSGYIDTALPSPLAPTLYSRTGDIPVLLALLFLFAVTLMPYVSRKD
ncbi:MAG: apolipoprotein N-acyltransferase [Planktotalea sp.]|uniref:apolipoprotein N-acyltransferase n=1 Tax=Planktotalea sp. TaxID=2029877 RepID=UPI003C74B066